MKHRWVILLLIFLCFFVIGFISNIIGPIIPDIIDSYRLSLTLVSLLPFAIYLAYGIISIPAGLFIERFNEKSMLIIAFVLVFLSALFITLFPKFYTAVISLFIFGGAMAMMQVSLHPILRATGGEEHFSFNSTVVQLVFGAASYVSPLLYSFFVTRLHSGIEIGPALQLFERITAPGLSWVSLYTLILGIALIMIIFNIVTRFPAVKLTPDEQVGSVTSYRELLKNRSALLFFLGIFLYVGVEIGIASWLSKYLMEYHHYDPHTTGAKSVSWFWGIFTAGNVITLILLKFFDAKKILIVSGFLSIVCFIFAVIGGPKLSLAGFLSTSLAISPMWPIIFSLGMNSVDSHHGAMSGLLATAIIGGAVVPVLIGAVGDLFGLRTGMLLIFGCLIYITTIGFRAKPLVTNKRFGDGKSHIS